MAGAPGPPALRGNPHVSLPVTFLEHVRNLKYQTPTITVARFAAHYDETVPTVGWASAVPWRSAATTLVPEPRTVTGKAQFDATTPVRDRPHASLGKRRKPRKA